MSSQTKEKIYITVITLLLALCAQFYFTYRYEPAHAVRVYYNKEQALNWEIINLIREADEYIFFAIYTFTRTDIKDALLSAKYRGVRIVGLTDKKQVTDIDLQKNIITDLTQNDIPVYKQDHDNIMHLKTIVSEKAYASGSFNWTLAGTNNNDEILEVGTDENIRTQYEKVLKKIIDRYQ